MTRSTPHTALARPSQPGRPTLRSGSLPYLGAALPVGLAGAASLATFLLILDAWAGHPLGTPNLLGAALLRGESLGLDAPIQPGLVLGYSLLHGAAFLAVAAAAVSAEYTLSSRGVPLRVQLVAGFAGLFVALQALFMLLALLLGLSFETLGIGRIAVANLLAALAMASVVAVRRRIPLEDD